MAGVPVCVHGFLLGLLLPWALVANADGPDFVALGDMPYGESADVEARYYRLIDAINAVQPAFSVHVGDIKSGGTSCSDAALLRQRDNFRRFAQALVYTPGDNEWTDCHRSSNGGFSPTERLDRLRDLFFELGRSLGRATTPGVSQPELTPEFGAFVENRRWEQAGLVFVTVHVVGSNNGLQSPAPDARAEHARRTRADRVWLELAFHRAREIDARAVVVFMQGDPFAARAQYDDFPEESGFRGVFAEALLPLARDWARPVLLVHGDEHRLRNDRPFKFEGRPLTNLFRVEVPGDGDMRALLIRWIDGSDDVPFVLEPIAP